MKLMILDGNSVVNRAYYGVGYLSSRSGQPTGAIYGFITILQSLLDEEQPDALAVAFDEHGPTFRHLAYDGYKATRKPMPDDLASQLPILREVLSAMRIPMYSLQGWEADDILGTVGKACGQMGWNCVIVTGDKDSLQLVDDYVTVKLVTHKAKRTQSVNYTPEVFLAKYGFPPKGLIDLKALMGDSSDNYPGVPGVGEKTAMALMAQYGSLDEVYAHVDDEAIKPAVRKKLIAGKASAYESYDLAEIRCNAPVRFIPGENLLEDWDCEQLLNLFQQLDFGRLIDRYRLTERARKKTTAEEYALPVISVAGDQELENLYADLSRGTVAVAVTEDLEELAICTGELVYQVSSGELGFIGYQGLMEVLWSDSVEKICHDSKTLMTRLLNRGIHAKGMIYDTALAAYLLEPTRSGYPAMELVISYGAAVGQQGLVGEAIAIQMLGKILPERVREAGMEAVYRDIDLPLCQVLAQMEHVGIAVDREALIRFGEMLSKQIARYEEQIYAYTGETFNINSPKQLGTLLFETLGLPHGKKSQRGYSTNIDVLESIADKHPVVPLIIDYRMLTKLYSTYAEGLLKAIAEDGRIHSTFQNMVTATGRLSCTEPNLQNIPIRTEMGGEIRKMFVPAPGHVLVDADYSQIELRVLAHIAEDPIMIMAFCTGEDIHTQTAATVFGVAPELVTPQMRRSAKAVNFGIVYGISDFSLSGDIGVSRKEARAYIDNYLAHYQGVRRYMKEIVDIGREQGYVESMYGRRRELPELKSSNYNVRTGAERMALNTPIQGSAADIIKLAMIRVHRRMESEGLCARLVLQVHDELIVECPVEEAERVLALVTEEMQEAAKLKAPLLAEAHAGENWYAAK